MKNKSANYIFADKLYTYLLCEKEIIVYYKDNHTICNVINVKHPLYIESDLANGFLIVLNTKNTIFIYSFIDFKLQYKVDLGGITASFIYDIDNLCIYATSTNLEKEFFKLYKVNLETQEISTKVFDRLSLVTPCYIKKEELVMIEKKIGPEPEKISLLYIRINDLSLLQVNETQERIGPLLRLGNMYCYDNVNGLYNFVETKLYSYEELGIESRCVIYAKYYNEQYYLFAGQDTYVLSKELNIIYHIHNDEIDEWINDMLFDNDCNIFIKSNGVQIIKD